MAQDPHIRPDGIWDDNWYQSTGQYQNGGGGSSGGGGVTDYVSLAREQMKLMQEANKPAIDALQATIPTIGQRFAQSGESLKKTASNLEERYKGLLASITGEKETAVQDVTTNTSQELGRRGISTQGGLFGETINKKVLPVQRAFAGSLSDLGSTWREASSDIESKIANLPIAQTEAEQQVQQAIAQLQAGGNQTAVQSALNLYQQMQSQREAEANRSLKEKIANLESAGKTPSYTSVPQGNALVDASGNLIYYNNKTYAGGGGGGTGTTEGVVDYIRKMFNAP